MISIYLNNRTVHTAEWSLEACIFIIHNTLNAMSAKLSRIRVDQKVVTFYYVKIKWQIRNAVSIHNKFVFNWLSIWIIFISLFLHRYKNVIKLMEVLSL